MVMRNRKWRNRNAYTRFDPKPFLTEEGEDACTLRAFRLVEFEREIAFISKTLPDLPPAFPRLDEDEPEKPAPKAIYEPNEKQTTIISRLLMLPTEIQFKIIRPLLESRSPYPLPVNYKFQPSLEISFPRFHGRQMLIAKHMADTIYPRPHILHTHPSLYAKFLPEYYRLNTWLLDIGPLGEQRLYPTSRGALYASWPHDRIPVARDYVERLQLHSHWGGCGTWADVGRVACFPRLRELVLDLRLGGTIGAHPDEERPLVRVPASTELKAALRAAGFSRIREEGVPCVDCEAWKTARAEGGKRAGCVACLEVWVGDEDMENLERKMEAPGVIEEVWKGVFEQSKKVEDALVGKPEKVVVGYQRTFVEPQFVGRGWGED